MIKRELTSSDIEQVVAGTRVTDYEHWSEVAEIYAEGYWQENPVKAKKLFMQLVEEGKIIQPRLKNDNLVIFPGIGIYDTMKEVIMLQRSVGRENIARYLE